MAAVAVICIHAPGQLRTIMRSSHSSFFNYFYVPPVGGCICSLTSTFSYLNNLGQAHVYCFEVWMILSYTSTYFLKPFFALNLYLREEKEKEKESLSISAVGHHRDVRGLEISAVRYTCFEDHLYFVYI